MLKICKTVFYPTNEFLFLFRIKKPIFNLLCYKIKNLGLYLKRTYTCRLTNDRANARANVEASAEKNVKHAPETDKNQASYGGARKWMIFIIMTEK